ncbi:MAG: (2Fe-2S)-binding protein [Myxococcales bacterium]|nr:MAG: (2Fe-2S)-binding protein [Myxococcales bacterium]
MKYWLMAVSSDVRISFSASTTSASPRIVSGPYHRSARSPETKPNDFAPVENDFDNHFQQATFHLPLMIVCHCHGVTDREIRACVQNGARTPTDVGDHCGASTGCGGCTELVAEIVHGERRRLCMVKSDVAAAPRAQSSAMAG